MLYDLYGDSVPDERDEKVSDVTPGQSAKSSAIPHNYRVSLSSELLTGADVEKIPTLAPSQLLA